MRPRHEWWLVGDLELRFIKAAGVFLPPVAVGLAAVAWATGDPGFLVGAAGAALTAAVAWVQVSRRISRLEPLLGVTGLMLLVAAAVRPPGMALAYAVGYAGAVAAVVRLMKWPWPVMFGSLIVGATAVSLLRLDAGAETTVPALAVLAFSALVAGVLHWWIGRMVSAQRESLIALVDLAPDGVVAVDAEGRVLAVNRRFLELFDAESTAQVVGESIHRFVPEDMRRNHQKTFRDYFEHDGRPRPMGRRGLLKAVTLKGREFPAGISIVRLDLEIGPVAVALVRDMTEYADQLRMVEELSQARIELVASVSHELRTPLAAALGFAHLLRDGHLRGEEAGEALEALSDGLVDMSHLVEDLLVAARSELGLIEVVSEAVDLPAEAVRVVREMKADMPVNAAPGVRPARGDRARVRQVLRNLVANAVQHGGSDRGIYVVGDEGWVLVDVWDSGPPLDPGNLAKAFEPFSTLRRRTTLTEPLGLGLSISRYLARRMGGDVTYRHTGAYSVFTLRLPVAPT